MAVIIRNLESGSLTTTTAKTPGPATGKSWLVKSIILTNQDTVSRTITVKINGNNNAGGNALASIAPPAMAIAAQSTVVLDAEITLQHPSTGVVDSLSLTAGSTPTTGIDYVLNGVERDLV